MHCDVLNIDDDVSSYRMTSLCNSNVCFCLYRTLAMILGCKYSHTHVYRIRQCKQNEIWILWMWKKYYLYTDNVVILEAHISFYLISVLGATHISVERIISFFSINCNDFSVLFDIEGFLPFCEIEKSSFPFPILNIHLLCEKIIPYNRYSNK